MNIPLARRHWSDPLPPIPMQIHFVIGDREFAVAEGHHCHAKVGMWLWPSAVALAIEIARRDWTEFSVLELGCGCGLPGIVAASKGCRVTFLDYESVCCMRVSENLVANTVVGKSVTSDWRVYNSEYSFDSLIGSDIMLSANHSDSLASFVKKYWNRKGPCLFVDPARDKTERFKTALLREGFMFSKSVIRGPLRDSSMADFDLYVVPSGGRF